MNALEILAAVAKGQEIQGALTSAAQEAEDALRLTQEVEESGEAAAHEEARGDTWQAPDQRQAQVRPHYRDQDEEDEDDSDYEPSSSCSGSESDDDSDSLLEELARPGAGPGSLHRRSQRAHTATRSARHQRSSGRPAAQGTGYYPRPTQRKSQLQPLHGPARQTTARDGARPAAECYSALMAGPAEAVAGEIAKMAVQSLGLQSGKSTGQRKGSKLSANMAAKLAHVYK